jgi:hypothetical protein
MVPTRELAVQVAKAVSGYGKRNKIKVVPVYGGAGFAEQVRALRQNADVVVATPGRAHDHLRRGSLDLSGLMTVVLDEADEMMDMGFAEDIDALLSASPATRQTVLFSATMPPRIAAIAAKHQTNPVKVQIAAPVTAAGGTPKVKELVYHVRHMDKPLALARLLGNEPDATAIVFVRTRNDADGVASEAVAATGKRTGSCSAKEALPKRPTRAGMVASMAPMSTGSARFMGGPFVVGSIVAGVERDQAVYDSDPVHTSPVRALVARRLITSVPARLAMTRLIENDPLGARVIPVALATATPLSRMTTDQAWPTTLLSTSASTSTRPFSGDALSFQVAERLQVPERRTSPVLADAAGTVTASSPTVSPSAAAWRRLLRVMASS